jgi:folate-binding protein YgfZ
MGIVTDAVKDKAKSILAGKAAAEGAAVGDYCGAETALRFGGVDAEFSAITSSCGIYDLGWRGKISVTGNDRARWLNGMVTNNIKDLKPNQGNYNFLLSAQGRIQGDMYVYERGERLLIDTERSQVEHLMKTLEHFIIMDDVELADVNEQIASIGVQGPKAKEVLESCGIEPSCADALLVCDLQWNGNDIAVTRMASEAYLTYEIWLAPAMAISLWEALRGAGAIAVGAETLEKFRVVAGVPRYGVDIRDRDLPQETKQEHALNFTKGCYIGQEIVERIRSRGNVHRMFTGFELTGEVPPGAKVTDSGGKEVGEITSVANVRGRHLALGYVRREAENSELTANDVAVKPARVPFKLG